MASTSSRFEEKRSKNLERRIQGLACVEGSSEHHKKADEIAPDPDQPSSSGRSRKGDFKGIQPKLNRKS